MDQGFHHYELHNHYSGAISIDTGSGDRFPQWSIQETREFLTIRGELDPTFMETKRNKLLWEVISTRLKEKGYNRSAEQCKCKWKNLVTRYKGCETMEAEGMRQSFPFYNELQVIFAARMQRMLWLEAEGGGASKKKTAADQFSSDEEEINAESGEEQSGATKKKRKMKGNNGNYSTASNNNNAKTSIVKTIKDMMEEFMRQQMQIEMQWMKAFELREEERRVKEMEWRQIMEALENERIMMDKKWREREEQRKIREEARAEKRDALITALLNKLRREDM